MAKVSLEELVTILCMSPSTVSKALRDRHEISVETKNSILQPAHEKGYQASPYAMHLRHQKNKTIAVIVPELPNNFFRQDISGSESAVRQKDYHILFYMTQEEFQ